MHIWSLANIYIGHMYMFSMFIYLCLCVFHAEYVQIGANWCKYMLCCTSPEVVDDQGVLVPGMLVLEFYVLDMVPA